MTYARARLFLGASAVGTLSVAAAVSLLLDLPALLPSEVGAFGTDVASLALVVALAAAVIAPFDLFGGWLLPREYGRSRERVWRFAARYARGVVVHSAVLVTIATLLLWAARVGGSLATLSAFALVSLTMLAAQPQLASVIGSTRLRAARGAEPVADLGVRTRVLETDHPHVTGGAYGLPGRTGWVVAGHWLRRGAEVALDAQVRRRAWIATSGARDRGVLLALTWNLAPVLAIVILNGAPDTVAALTRLALVSTLWSFVGLFVLPAPSRHGVYHADRAALLAGVDPVALQRGIALLERDQDDEHERSEAVESVFHPVPAAQHRVRAMLAGDATASAGRPSWHAARTALYLSWAGIGLLGRAVHCNLGRPEAWVFLPSD